MKATQVLSDEHDSLHASMAAALIILPPVEPATQEYPAWKMVHDTILVDSGIEERLVLEVNI